MAWDRVGWSGFEWFVAEVMRCDVVGWMGGSVGSGAAGRVGVWCGVVWCRVEWGGTEWNLMGWDLMDWDRNEWVWSGCGRVKAVWGAALTPANRSCCSINWFA